MYGSVVMAWGPTDVRTVSFEASGTPGDGDVQPHRQETRGVLGTLTATNCPGWGPSEVVIWAQDAYKGWKEGMAWIWSNVDYDP